MLGPLLLNIFINDLLLFLQNSYLHNFADDDIIWAFVNDMNLEKESETDQVIIINRLGKMGDSCNINIGPIYIKDLTTTK